MRKFIVALLCCLAMGRAHAQTDTVTDIPAADKLYGLSTFWSEAKYNFVYFDKTHLDWDSAYRAFIPQVLATKSIWSYYKTMLRFCSLLKDGHTNIDFPFSLFTVKGSTWTNISLKAVGHHLYVNAISKQRVNEVPLGSEVVAVNGEPVGTYLDREVFPYIGASTDYDAWNAAARFFFQWYGADSTSKCRVTLHTPKGGTAYFDYQVTALDTIQWASVDQHHPPGTVSFKRIGAYGYVALNSFANIKTVMDFLPLLPRLDSCKGIVIDIRYNGGGNSGVGGEILKYFTDEKVLTGSRWRTRDNEGAYKAWGTYYLQQHPNPAMESLGDFDRKCVEMVRGDHWYTGDTMRFENQVTRTKIKAPLVILMGNNTASAAEDFLLLLESVHDRTITTVGQRSYGSTGQPMPLTLPGGITGRICTKRDEYADGRQFVGYGVKPQVEVPHTVDDLLSGKDRDLEMALQVLDKATGQH